MTAQNPAPPMVRMESVNKFFGQLHVNDRCHPDVHGVMKEIRAVLDKERFLLPPTDNVRVYCEFVAVAPFEPGLEAERDQRRALAEDELLTRRQPHEVA